MNEVDFERSWLSKFSDCLHRIAGKEIRKKVLKNCEKLTSGASQKEIIDWTAQAIRRLEALVDEEKRTEIMTGCACRYPESDLQEITETYQKTKDLGLVHKMLQEKFTSFLKDSLELENELVEQILKRGWGLAGVKKGNTIIATKIPKSGSLVEYMQEQDWQKRRELYCHCPRIRGAIKSRTDLSPTYCYCGAGFYKGVWEYILQQPVKVELLESVLKGDDVCKIAIRLPQARY